MGINTLSKYKYKQMADNGKFEDAGSDGMAGETSATHHQSPGPNSPSAKGSVKINARSNSTDLGMKGNRYTQ